MLGDSRFSKMFEDKEYARDKNSEHYKLLKPTESKFAESDDEEADKRAKAAAPSQNMNQIFAGKEESDHSDEDGVDNFEKKMTKKEKKNQKMDRSKDKIIANYGALKQKIQQVEESSKGIKKSMRKMKKGDISEQDVKRRLKTKRVVIPSRR